MAGLRGCFLDTSVLVAGVVEMGPSSRASQEVMAAVADGRIDSPTTGWHCCLEFYSVLTRLPIELRVSPAVALELVEEELLGRFSVVGMPARGRLRFLRSAAAEGVSGGRIYDAHVAEVARLADASLVVTENRRHFTSLLRHGLRVLTASELVEELPPAAR